MNDSSRIKIGVFLAALAVGSVFALWISKPRTQHLRETVDAHAPVPELSRPKIRVLAENSPIVFDRDLETSLQKQKPPIVILEYVMPNESSVDLRLSRETRQDIERLWRKSMDSSLANIRAVDRESRIRVDANYINDTAIFISELEQTSVSTPVGIKRLEGEAGMVARTINELAIRRFLELHEMNKSVRERSIETYVSQ